MLEDAYATARRKVGAFKRRVETAWSASRPSTAPDAAPSENGRKEPHFVRTYAAHTKNLIASWGSREGALQAAVGSATPEEFEAIGKLEKSLLLYAGLRPDAFLLDIGCGSGRLAVHLKDWLKGPYLGTDVVQTLLDHAAETCNRPDWRFTEVSGLTVPAESDSVDMACAFSVFTHLRHEESYVYLRDILRVLKPGALLVFSFLEFRVPEHWNVMEGNINAVGQDVVLNQFMGIDAVEAFAEHLGFELVEAHRGDEPFFPVTDRSAGAGADPELGSIGQSVAIYRKPPSRAN